MTDWQRLANVLLEAAGDEVAGRGHPAWVRVLGPPVGGDGDEFALALSDDEDALMGWVATADCLAVGVIATGRLRALPGAPPGCVDPNRDRIRMACLVARDGETAWKMRLPDGTTTDEAPTEGRMLDCLRRCFELPTPPPPTGTGRLQAVAWMTAIMEAARDARRPLSWSEVSRLHPVARVLDGDLGRPGSELPPGLMRMAGSAWSWEDFRRQAERDGSLGDLVDPELAGWMDEGMFARWVLSGLPSPDEMLAAIRAQLSPTAARRLAHAVHAVSQPEPAGATG